MNVVRKIMLLCSTSPAALAARPKLVLVPEPEIAEGGTGIWVDEWADIEAGAFERFASGAALISEPTP